MKFNYFLPMPEHNNLIKLIKKLKESAGDEPLVINFADGNHVAGNTHSTLLEPEVLSALKQAGVKHIILETDYGKKTKEIYEGIKSKISENQNYSFDDFLKDENLEHNKLNAYTKHYIKLLINSAKEGMEIDFPDNATVKGSAGEISSDSFDILKFLQHNTSIYTKQNQECIETVYKELANKIPKEQLYSAITEIELKRLVDNSPSDIKIAEETNEKTSNGKNVAVVYGVLHFIGEKDLNDLQSAKHKIVILIATDNDLVALSGHYQQSKQLPQYRHNPETGETSKFDIEQINSAVLTKLANTPSENSTPINEPIIKQQHTSTLTDEQCKALIPEDLRFKNYHPVEISLRNLFNRIFPSIPDNNNDKSQNISPTH